MVFEQKWCDVRSVPDSLVSCQSLSITYYYTVFFFYEIAPYGRKHLIGRENPSENYIRHIVPLLTGSAKPANWLTPPSDIGANQEHFAGFAGISSLCLRNRHTYALSTLSPPLFRDIVKLCDRHIWDGVSEEKTWQKCKSSVFFLPCNATLLHFPTNRGM